MRPDLEKIIPGLAEARVAEETARAVAFLAHTETLLGVEVLPLTLRAYYELSCARNLAVAGMLASHASICTFLWRISPRFCRPGTLHWLLSAGYRRKLRKHVRRLNPITATAEIREWIDHQFQDAPPQIEGAGSGNANKPPKDYGFFWLAGFIDFFAEAYGWSEDETMDRPIARLYQLFRANLYAKGNKVPSALPSDRLVRKWFNHMREVSAKNAAEGTATT